MTDKWKALLLPGDGIGHEVMGQVKEVIDWLNNNFAAAIAVDSGLVGGASIDAFGQPLTDETLELARNSDAVLLGAVGGPKWDKLPFAIKPERGLLRLRSELGLFVNLRPAICYASMVNQSSLKPELVSGLDIMIVRELTGGVYFGLPCGIETMEDGSRRGVNTHVYSTEEIRRVIRFACKIAMTRQKRIMSVDKANVMEAGILWREEAEFVCRNEFPEIQLEHMYADNCAMQLIKAPKQFDVIVTDNLFGDILSDAAAMMTGSLGMLPSASLGGVDKITGKSLALYEPVHGSAPDIAGKNIANPIAAISSLSMAMRYSFNNNAAGDLIDKAIGFVLENGMRTGDIMQAGAKQLSTSQMGTQIIKAMTNLAAAL